MLSVFAKLNKLNFDATRPQINNIIQQNMNLNKFLRRNYKNTLKIIQNIDAHQKNFSLIWHASIEPLILL